MGSEKPIIHVLSRHYKDGNAWYKLLVDGRYWIANQWEYECIKQGHDPEELGMFEHRKDDD